MRLLNNTGERQVDPRNIAPDHFARYEFVSDYLRERTVLDAGCGIGYGALVLAAQDCKVIAVDNSADAIDFANEHCAHDNIEYVCADLMDYEVPQVDAIVAFEILEHLADPEAVIKRLDADRFFASVPHEAVLPFDSKKFPFHARHFMPDEFEWLLGQGGYEVRGRWSQKEKWNGTIDDGWEDGRILIAYGVK